MYNLEKDAVEVSDQNVDDLDTKGQNLDVSSDTLHKRHNQCRSGCAW